MADPQDVIPGSSPGSESPPNPDASAAPGVTGVAEGADRPIENLKGEFDRKLTKVERQLAEIAAGLAALTSRPAAPEPAPAQEYTDQQVLELANAGNAAAHQEYVRRMVAQQVAQQQQGLQQQQFITAQLQTLYGKYPQLTDPSHALTQAAMQAKMALVRMGHPAQAAATDLDAIKLAIVDNPGLVQPAPGAVPSGGSSRTPQQGIDGASSRRPVSPSSPPRALSQKERDIAARMGIANPIKALKRFEHRQATGRSSVSPLVNQIVREETP